MDGVGYIDGAEGGRFRWGSVIWSREDMTYIFSNGDGRYQGRGRLEIWELLDPLPIMQLLGHTNH